MSIEKDIARIATATEAILAMMQGTKVEMVGATPVAPKSNYKPEQIVSKELTAVTEAVAVVAAEVEPSEDEVRNAVREYMNRTNKDKAIELLIKYGAKKEKPMIKDVTQKSALMAEIKNG